MTLDKLREIANDNDIEIMSFSCPESRSMSIMSESGDCYIGIDNRPMTEAEERLRTAHELGHCINGAFYNRYSKYDVIGKHEYTADKWAVQQLIPVDELLEAVKCGLTESWELAERFNVPESFICKAYKIYKAMRII